MMSGDLSVFPLLPVLQMLLASGKSGVLSVDHVRGGELWFGGGELLHAHSGALRGEDALQLLCSLDSGLFTFEPGQAPPEQTLKLRQDAALHRMLQDADAWLPLLKLFPDWSRPLRFTGRWSDQQPVTRQQYRVLSLLQGTGRSSPSLRQILDASGLPPRTVLELYRPFVVGGLIEVA